MMLLPHIKRNLKCRQQVVAKTQVSGSIWSFKMHWLRIALAQIRKVSSPRALLRVMLRAKTEPQMQKQQCKIM